MSIKARKFFQFHRYPRTTNWVRCLNTSATATSVLIVSHRKLSFKATHAQFNLREPRKAAIIMDNQPDLETNQPKLWELRLYVAGQTPKAIAAFINLKKVCEQYLEGQYQIEIIDLLNDPKLGQQDHIFALPTLVRKIPRPLKQIIGDLSSPEKILVGLELWRGEGRGKKSLI